MSIHFLHWHEKEKQALSKAKDFNDLAEIALGIIKRMPKNIHVVSGPISTGGVGTPTGNMKVFSGVIEILCEKGLNIFSWVPFESKMHEFHLVWSKTNGKDNYCMPILDDFYHIVFSSGKITNVHFIHGWESSFGARWEHQLCEKLNIERTYLPPEISQEALNR